MIRSTPFNLSLKIGPYLSTSFSRARVGTSSLTSSRFPMRGSPGGEGIDLTIAIKNSGYVIISANSLELRDCWNSLIYKQRRLQSFIIHDEYGMLFSSWIVRYLNAMLEVENSRRLAILLTSIWRKRCDSQLVLVLASENPCSAGVSFWLVVRQPCVRRGYPSETLP